MNDIIGLRVNVPGATGHAVLRYVGIIHGKNGVFAGLELQGTLAATRGKNSGAVENVQYFDVEIPKSGLFIPYERLRSVNPKLPDLKTYLSHFGDTIIINETLSRPASAAGIEARTPTSRTSSVGNALPIGSFAASYPSANNAGEATEAPIYGINTGHASDTMHTTTEYTTTMVLPAPATTVAPAAPPPPIPQTTARTPVATTDTRSISNNTPLLKNSVRSPLSPISQTGGYLNARMGAMSENIYKEMNSNVVDVSQYETEIKELRKLLKEKDRRLEGFARQREEWHNAMDDLMAVQQDGMQVFEDRIHELENVNAKQAKELTRLKEELRISKESMKQLEDELEHLRSKGTEKKEIGKLRNLDEAKTELNEDKHKQLAMGDSQIREIQKLKRELEESRFKIGELENDKNKQSHEDHMDSILAEDIQNVDLLGSLKTTSREISQSESDSKLHPNVHPKQELQNPHRDAVESTKRSTETVLMENTANSSSSVSGNYVASTSSDLIQGSTHPTHANFTTDLPIYKAPKPIDPAEGRNDWCGLCERDGHSSIDCPFENDIF